jgi:hypothetical protein
MVNVSNQLNRSFVKCLTNFEVKDSSEMPGKLCRKLNMGIVDHGLKIYTIKNNDKTNDKKTRYYITIFRYFKRYTLSTPPFIPY